MDRYELHETLKREAFDPQSYDLQGGLLPERYTLSEECGVWCVYYSERGRQSDKREFASEEEACCFLLDAMRNDPTTKLWK